MRHVTALLTLAVLSFATSGAMAEVVYDRPLDATRQGRFSNVDLSGVQDYQQFAHRVTLGSSAAVTDVVWYGYFQPDPAVGPFEFSIRVYDEAAGAVPGSILSAQTVSPSLVDTGQTTDFGGGTRPVYELSAAGLTPIFLASGTNYWVSIVLNDPAIGGQFLWSRSTLNASLDALRSSDTDDWSFDFNRDPAFRLVSNSVPVVSGSWSRLKALY